MRILITGVTGFVGSNLLNYFKDQKGVELYGMVRYRKDETDLKDTLLKGIVTKEEVIADFRYDVVIHLAGKAHDIKKVADKKEYYLSNEKLTADLYDAFLSYEKPGSFIYISSVSVFSIGSTEPYTENKIPNPKTPYGISKYNAENYIQNKEYVAGKNYYILRPSIIYGPNSKGNLNLLFSMVESGIPYPLGAFENKKSFLSVYNLCFILEELSFKKIPSGIYHIADNEVLSTVDVVKLIYESIGRRPRILKIPRSIVKMAAYFGDRFRILINTERLAKLTQNFIVSNRKIKEELGIDLPVNSYDGLRKTFDYYLRDKKIKAD